jgi:hypothetical protein
MLYVPQVLCSLQVATCAAQTVCAVMTPDVETALSPISDICAAQSVHAVSWHHHSLPCCHEVVSTPDIKPLDLNHHMSSAKQSATILGAVTLLLRHTAQVHRLNSMGTTSP